MIILMIIIAAELRLPRKKHIQCMSKQDAMQVRRSNADMQCGCGPLDRGFGLSALFEGLLSTRKLLMQPS